MSTECFPWRSTLRAFAFLGQLQLSRKRTECSFCEWFASSRYEHREFEDLMQKNCVEMECRAKGLRLTEQRDDGISLATVYRTVRRMEAEGIVERHEFGDGRSRYEIVTRKHHDHLINLENGKIVEFTSPEIERLQREIARRLGFKLVRHRLELYARPAAQALRSQSSMRVGCKFRT
jgi:Fur family ferric uptake transcriptional regulator